MLFGSSRDAPSRAKTFLFFKFNDEMMNVFMAFRNIAQPLYTFFFSLYSQLFLPLFTALRISLVVYTLLIERLVHCGKIFYIYIMSHPVILGIFSIFLVLRFFSRQVKSVALKNRYNTIRFKNSTSVMCLLSG